MTKSLPLVFTDHNSTFGSKVGGEDIKGQERVLKEGNVLQVGERAQFR